MDPRGGEAGPGLQATLSALLSALFAAVLLGACGSPPSPTPAGTTSPTSATTSTMSTSTGSTGSIESTGPATTTSTSPSTSTSTTTPSTSPSSAAPTGPVPSDGRPADALLSIPALGLTRLTVQSYEGWTDDRPGTAIQNRGRAASPTGPQGGTGAGGVGNYQVTAHRNSSTAAFFRLPALVDGDVVHVDAGGIRYTYRVSQTRETSFRSPASLAEQRAAVPGRPGVPATEAMITLSTCATQEDHAAGNRWADENDNPEHRIDKIGVLVETGPSPA